MKLSNWVTNCCKARIKYVNGGPLTATCTKCNKPLMTKVK